MLMPDHAPSHPDFTKETVVGKGSQFAFQFGVSARRDILIAMEMFLRSLRFFLYIFSVHYRDNPGGEACCDGG